MLDVLIIGGGVSGLYVLHELKHQFNHIKLIEMGKSVGGRVRTISENNKAIYEAGPWRFHASHQKLIKLINQLQIEYIQNSSSKCESVDSCDGYEIDSCAGLSSLDILCFDNTYEDAIMKEACFKLPLSADSSTSPYDLSNKYQGTFFFIKKGFSHLIESLAEPQYIELNSRATHVKYKKDYYVVYVSRRKEDGSFENVKYKSKYIFINLPPHAAAKIEGLSLLKPIIESVASVPLCHIYAQAPNLPERFYLNTNSLIGHVISADFEDNWVQVSYTSGKRACFWNRLMQKSMRCFQDKLHEELVKYNIHVDLTDIRSYYWGHAVHTWKPSFGFNLEKNVRNSVIPNAVHLPGLYLSGEAYSGTQGWIEGALESAEMAIELFHFDLTFKRIHRSLPSEYVIIDGRIVDVKR